MSWATRSIGIGVAALGLASAPAANAAITFNITSTGNANADAGFAAAAALWANVFADTMTVNIDAHFAALGAGVLGQAASVQANYTYTNARTALINDITTTSDTTATSNLFAAPAVPLFINRTSNNPNGASSSTPYLDNDGDANNTTIRLSNANAKAIGLLAANNAAEDADITFSSTFAFDFDRSDGINGGEIDFIGVAAHEIGHALGFISGVDVLDGNPTGFPDNVFTFVSALDLYRYSADSITAGGLDWAADNRAKFFSIDGGATSIVTFSNGVTLGDGRQASHWKDSLGIGIMDPTSAFGELLAITDNDLLAFDVIGYDLVPEPTMLSLLGVSSLLFARRRRAA